MASTEIFNRHIFPSNTVEKLFEKDLAQIEKLYADFSRLPDNQTLYFLSEEEFGRILSNPKEVEMAPAHIFNEVCSRFQFLLFTNLYKFLKNIESLSYSWNSKNYLAWVFFGRATIELCAIYNYFDLELKKINPNRTNFTIEEIQEIEKILIKYSHGTRFDWDSLIKGDLNKLKEKFIAGKEFQQAINVLTTIDKLSKLRPVFYDVRIIYDMLSDYAHPNMGSHSIFIDLPEDFQAPIKNRLALNVNASRGVFIVVGTLHQIAICLTYVGHLIQETSKIVELWGGFTTEKTFSIKFPNTVAVLKFK